MCFFDWAFRVLWDILKSKYHVVYRMIKVWRGRLVVILLKTHKAKLLQLFLLHPMKQQGSPCCHTFLTVNQSYHSKVATIVFLHAEKLDGIAPLITDPPLTISTTLSKKKKKKKKKMHLTCDRWHMTIDTWHVNMTSDTWHLTHDNWHMTCDTWHVTHDMWHMTCDTWQLTHDMWHMTCDTLPVTQDMWHMACNSWHVTRDM